MPYVAAGQIASALESLQRFHAFFGVTFLSMKKAGVSVGTSITWGSEQENGLLETYYSPAGAPAGKKYFVPFRAPEKEEFKLWKDDRYSGSSLQRARTNADFRHALVHPTKKEWGFASDYVSKLKDLLPNDGGGNTIRLPLFDLAAWLYRSENLPTKLSEIADRFKAEFGISTSEFSELFDSAEPSEEHFFAPEAISPDELIALTGGVPLGPDLAGRSESDLLAHIGIWLSDKEGLTLPAGFTESFYSSLKAQRFAVLAGRPGTGKTAFVRGLANALRSFFGEVVTFVEVSVSEEFSESDVVGYEKISGGLAATELTRKIFLSGRPNDIYVLLLDEMNLAQVDHYLARLLPAFESDSAVELPGTGTSHRLPADAFLVGTVNSFIEESTRLPLSGPVKRRAAVIQMPNALEELILEDDIAKFTVACDKLLEQTKNRTTARISEGRRSVLDQFRLNALDQALLSASKLHDVQFQDALWSLCKTTCSEPSTAMTFGVLQDILDYVAQANLDLMKAFGQQIATKVVPQLNGPASVARSILALVEELDASHPGDFATARSALNELLRTEDPSSGLVTYRY